MTIGKRSSPWRTIELVAEPDQPLLAAPDEDDPCAERGDLTGDGQAKARRRARDEDRPPGEDADRRILPSEQPAADRGADAREAADHRDLERDVHQRAITARALRRRPARPRSSWRIGRPAWPSFRSWPTCYTPLTMHRSCRVSCDRHCTKARQERNSWPSSGTDRDGSSHRQGFRLRRRLQQRRALGPGRRHLRAVGPGARGDRRTLPPRRAAPRQDGPHGLPDRRLRTLAEGGADGRGLRRVSRRRHQVRDDKDGHADRLRRRHPAPGGHATGGAVRRPGIRQDRAQTRGTACSALSTRSRPGA